MTQSLSSEPSFRAGVVALGTVTPLCSPPPGPLPSAPITQQLSTPSPTPPTPPPPFCALSLHL